MALIQISRKGDLNADLGDDMIKLLPAFGVNYQEQPHALLIPSELTIEEFEQTLDGLMPDWRDRYEVLPD
jgi:hypothetical protein